jgi:hypothetical protein
MCPVIRRLIFGQKLGQVKVVKMKFANLPYTRPVLKGTRPVWQLTRLVVSSPVVEQTSRQHAQNGHPQHGVHPLSMANRGQKTRRHLTASRNLIFCIIAGGILGILRPAEAYYGQPRHITASRGILRPAEAYYTDWNKRE